MRDMRDLEERVLQFDMLRLPGQIQTMHMGTSYLVHDLLKEVKKYKGHLENILAITHRDGGHYTAVYGIEKSVKDAMLIISNAVVK